LNPNTTRVGTSTERWRLFRGGTNWTERTRLTVIWKLEFSVSEATLVADEFQPFSLFGANGYRLGNAIVSAHVNGVGTQLSPAVFQNSPTGIVNAQVHFDTVNP